MPIIRGYKEIVDWCERFGIHIKEDTSRVLALSDTYKKEYEDVSRTLRRYSTNKKIYIDGIKERYSNACIDYKEVYETSYKREAIFEIFICEYSFYYLIKHWIDNENAIATIREQPNFSTSEICDLIDYIEMTSRNCKNLFLNFYGE